MKKCAGCGNKLPICKFYKSKKNKDGIRGKCIDCFSLYSKKEEVKEKKRQYGKTERGKESHKRAARKYLQTENGKKLRCISTKKHQKTKKYKDTKREYRKGDTHREYQKIYRENPINKEHRRLQQIEYRKTTKYRESLKTPINKLKKNLYSRLRGALKGKIKVGSHVRDLGCTIEELRIHIEKQFTDGMAWENWGRIDSPYKAWNIDHIIPISSFDLTKREELLKACHYTNLQPLWAVENIKKSNK